ncbi:aminodeoxychorismate/anthranilate synthase component II [uncultured Brachyspira sp.]|uniref:anthranilate synthase component II n=1 Tax=uncultured Brachyspira sp. TaxID=221953 RepID=UPI0026261A71|nr:aminodeoxychorismate/anthranilate synthase component II [uncultured Brachyspira sp.]
MILLIDNYDSFSYNLYQLIGKFCSNIEDIKVIKNDELTLEEIEYLNPKLIVISPGPGKPSDAGLCIDIIKNFYNKIPIFGVCLGHQAICEAFGAKVDHASKVMHGKTSVINIDNNSLIFRDLPNNIKVARYHSLSAKKDTVSDCLKISAFSDDDEIMAVEHRDYPVFGVQFHPESVMTENGIDIIRNLFRCIEK